MSNLDLTDNSVRSLQIELKLIFLQQSNPHFEEQVHLLDMNICSYVTK